MSCRVTLPLFFAFGILVVSCAPLVGAEQAAETSTFPQTAYVIKRVAVARSGPGMSHYPTDALPEGEPVEILEKEEAWLAIRTPADSYSWVPRDRLKLDKDGKTAEVARDNVTAWVGSNIEAVDTHISQVKLRRGERVIVLGQRDVAAEGETPRIWVKIEPPTGERRWLLAEDVDTNPPPGRRPPERRTRSSGLRAEEEEDSQSGWTDRTTGLSRKGRADLVAADSDRTSTADRRTSDGSRREVTGSRAKVPTNDGKMGNWTSLLQFPDAATFDDRLARVQLALSRAAASGGTSTQMDLLEQRARELVEGGKSAYERGQATILLESVREFRTLARRRRASVQRASYAGPRGDGPIGSGLKQGPDSAKPQGLLESITAEVRAIADAAGTMESTLASASTRSAGSTGTSPYLAEGWLMPVSSPTRAAPPFVLMDDDGHPVAFITPAPGVNLRRYVDKQVGIMGQTAFGVLDRQHVVAHRAIELDRHRGSVAPPRTASPWIRTREAEAAGVRR